MIKTPPCSLEWLLAKKNQSPAPAHQFEPTDMRELFDLIRREWVGMTDMERGKLIGYAQHMAMTSKEEEEKKVG